jgi:hypothetical protein
MTRALFSLVMPFKNVVLCQVFFVILIITALQEAIARLVLTRISIPTTSLALTSTARKALRVSCDGISCMNFINPPSYYLHPKHERVAHFQELSVQLDAVIAF